MPFGNAGFRWREKKLRDFLSMETLVRKPCISVRSQNERFWAEKFFGTVRDGACVLSFNKGMLTLQYSRKVHDAWDIPRRERLA